MYATEPWAISCDFSLALRTPYKVRICLCVEVRTVNMPAAFKLLTAGTIKIQMTKPAAYIADLLPSFNSPLEQLGASRTHLRQRRHRPRSERRHHLGLQSSIQPPRPSIKMANGYEVRNPSRFQSANSRPVGGASSSAWWSFLSSVSPHGSFRRREIIKCTIPT